MTKGNETEHLVRFSVPLLIGNVFQQFYNISNSMVVGKHIGDDALAGVGTVSGLTFLFFSMCIGLAIGVGIIVAHAFGAGDNNQIKKAIGNSIYILGAVGSLMSILGVVFAKPILTFMDTPEDVMPYALTYMRIMCGGTIFVAAYNGISTILRSLGDTKIPLIVLMIASLINAVLDIVFVTKLEMGVAGAALATVSSQAFSAIVSILIAVRINPYLRLKKEHYKFDKTIFIQSAKIGIPIGLQNSMIAISIVALQRVVNSFGPVTMAAFTAVSRIEQLIQGPFNSMGSAMSTFTGQNLGIGDVDRVKTAFKKATKLILGFSICAYIIFLIGGEWVIGRFVSNPESVAMGAKALRITGLFYIPLGLIYISRGVLNGAGDGRFALITGIVEVIGRVGFSMLFVQIPAIGVWGLWGTTGLTWFITGVAGILRYKQGKWKTMKL